MNAIPKIQSFSCPCCGGFIGEAAPIETVIDGVSLETGKAILRRLSMRLGVSVSSRTLIDFIYADDIDGGPENDRRVFHVTLHRVRKQIAAYGWMIERKGGGGPGNPDGGYYRLIPTEAGQ